MAIEMCSRCDKRVDLDWHVEDIVYIDNKAICIECLSEEEIEILEKKGEL